MDIENIAEKIAMTIITVLSIILAVWLLIQLPLWFAPVAFSVLLILGAAFLGPIIAIFSFVAAAGIIGIIWLISRRRVRS